MNYNIKMGGMKNLISIVCFLSISTAVYSQRKETKIL